MGHRSLDRVENPPATSRNMKQAIVRYGDMRANSTIPYHPYHITSHHITRFTPQGSEGKGGNPPSQPSIFEFWSSRSPFLSRDHEQGLKKKGNKREKLKGKGTDLPFTGLLSVI